MNFLKKIILLIILFFVNSFHIDAVEVQQVTILADDSYPPYSFLENGVLKGVYIDIVRASAKLINSRYEVKIVAIPWKRGLLEIKGGRAFAILPPYKHIEKRSYIWPYSVPIMTENVVAYCQKDVLLLDYINKSKKSQKPPLNIGINAGYLILNEEFKQAKEDNKIIIWENKSTFSNIMKLYSKRIDCYLNDKISTLWELSKIPSNKNINFDNIQEALFVMSKTAHIGYTDNKNHNFEFKSDFILRMDQALSTIISSDKYHEIIQRYN